MLSFLSRCSIILPLVCALGVVASGDLFNVKSVKNGHYISKHVIAKGSDITLANHNQATHLRIHPAPDPHKRLVTASFKSVDHNLYIGVERKPGSPMKLVWVPHEYKWQVGRQDDGKYLVYIEENHLSWFDSLGPRSSGPLLLVAPNVYTPLPTLVWEFDPVKHK